MAIWSPTVETLENGNVAVTNFPAVQPVNDNGASLTVDGSVSVDNFPASQVVSDGGGSLTVDGSVNVGNFPATQAVSDGGGSLTVDGSVAVTGTVSVSNFPNGSVAVATVSSVTVTTAATTMAAANPARVKLIVTTEAGTTYVKLGTGASLASYTYRLVQNTTLEITQYTGAVTAIRSSGSGTCLVTEL